MIIADIINSLFELAGGIFVLNHCRIVARDKAVAGVSIISVVFFILLGAWNLIYYPSLNQWFSFSAGILIFLANILWVCLLMKYYRKGRLDNDKTS